MQVALHRAEGQLSCQVPIRAREFDGELRRFRGDRPLLDVTQ